MTPQALQTLLRPILTPFGKGYGALMVLRRTLWEKGAFHSFTPAYPCAAVGNIAWGGSGKTPVVDWLLSRTAKQGLEAVVLTRGYGAHPPVLPFPVLPTSTAAEAGDEPLMLRLRHPAAAVLVDPVRARAARLAEQTLQPDLLLLDDGFQHLAVKRHLNLVLLRPEDLREEWNRVLPAGSWREPAEALHRADAFLIKLSPSQLPGMLCDLRRRLAPYGKPLFSFFLRPGIPRQVNAGSSGETLLPSGPYALVSGVGNPKQVKTTFSRFMGCAPAIHCIFPDHHAYTAEEASRLATLKMPILCTSKDAVKLRGMPVPNLWELPVTAAFGPALWSSMPFARWWDTWFTEAREALARKEQPPAPRGYDPAADTPQFSGLRTRPLCA
ncbi:MAG TPA: tetraacyldisaccharide 4'-kinase [Candidatus Avidesulfovibrio excrementigallinarum]|nr:tetraacyldisaccharide 4'-kinase [Candidatus Avidesulfovibrio excrementigallinarum]